MSGSLEVWRPPDRSAVTEFFGGWGFLSPLRE
jgi:hypothetical protein